MTLLLFAAVPLLVSVVVLLWAYVLGLKIEQREADERVLRQLARCREVKPYFVPDPTTPYAKSRTDA